LDIDACKKQYKAYGFSDVFDSSKIQTLFFIGLHSDDKAHRNICGEGGFK